MALIHVDVLTPKQVMFFGGLMNAFKAQGHEVLLTTRRYREVDALLKRRRLKAVWLGAHGGAERYRKLEESLRRTLQLSKLLKKASPAVSVSYSSPEAARASFGLGIPHVCISDSPHSEFVSRLAVPLSRRLLTPWIIPKAAWRRFGIAESAVVQYRAIDPAAWLKDKPRKKISQEPPELGGGLPLILVRPSEEFASYLSGHRRGVSAEEALGALLMRFANRAHVAVLPRYIPQLRRLKRLFKGRITVIEKPVHGPSLLRQVTLFIGGGGTMTAEAALMGIPAVSIFPRPSTYVESFLIRQGLVWRVESVNRLIAKAESVLSSPEEQRASQRERAAALLARMENPLPRIASVVFEFC